MPIATRNVGTALSDECVLTRSSSIQAKIMELKGHRSGQVSSPDSHSQIADICDSPSEACRALDDFIDLRLAIDEKWQWVAKALVTRVWITIEELADQADEVSSLRTAFDAVLARSQKPLDAGATHAIHVVCQVGSCSITLL